MRSIELPAANGCTHNFSTAQPSKTRRYPEWHESRVSDRKVLRPQPGPLVLAAVPDRWCRPPLPAQKGTEAVPGRDVQREPGNCLPMRAARMYRGLRRGVTRVRVIGDATWRRSRECLSTSAWLPRTARLPVQSSICSGTAHAGATRGCIVGVALVIESWF
jgi:hypothetical protein